MWLNVLIATQFLKIVFTLWNVSTEEIERKLSHDVIKERRSSQYEKRNLIQKPLNPRTQARSELPHERLSNIRFNMSTKLSRKLQEDCLSPINEQEDRSQASSYYAYQNLKRSKSARNKKKDELRLKEEARKMAEAI